MFLCPDFAGAEILLKLHSLGISEELLVWLWHSCSLTAHWAQRLGEDGGSWGDPAAAMWLPLPRDLHWCTKRTFQEAKSSCCSCNPKSWINGSYWYLLGSVPISNIYLTCTTGNCCFWDITVFRNCQYPLLTPLATHISLESSSRRMIWAQTGWTGALCPT